MSKINGMIGTEDKGIDYDEEDFIIERHIYRRGKGERDMTETPDPEKTGRFLRKEDKGGVFFFIPKAQIYYMSGKHVEEVLSGKRDFLSAYIKE